MSSAFHYVLFRTSAHASEDLEKVKQALRFAAGVDEKQAMAETHLEGHHGNPIHLLEIELKANARIRDFWKHLRVQAPDVVEGLAGELDRRMDDAGNFYLRLSKQEAFLGRLRVTTEEDAIQVRVKVAAFPAKSEVALQNMRAFLDTLREN